MRLRLADKFDRHMSARNRRAASASNEPFAHDEARLLGEPPSLFLFKQREELDAIRIGIERLEAELLINRSLPRNVAKGRERHRLMAARTPDAPAFVDQATRKALALVMRIDINLIKMPFAVDGEKHRKGDHRAPRARHERGADAQHKLVLLNVGRTNLDAKSVADRLEKLVRSLLDAAHAFNVGKGRGFDRVGARDHDVRPPAQMRGLKKTMRDCPIRTRRCSPALQRKRGAVNARFFDIMRGAEPGHHLFAVA